MCSARKSLKSLTLSPFLDLLENIDVFCRKISEILTPFLIFKHMAKFLCVLQNNLASNNLSNLSFLASAEQLIFAEYLHWLLPLLSCLIYRELVISTEDHGSIPSRVIKALQICNLSVQLDTISLRVRLIEHGDCLIDRDMLRSSNGGIRCIKTLT